MIVSLFLCCCVILCCVMRMCGLGALAAELRRNIVMGMMVLSCKRQRVMN